MSKVIEAMPNEWDKRPISLSYEIRTFLESVKDEGSHIDSGTDGVTGDLWVKVDGVEYIVVVAKAGTIQVCNVDKESGQCRT